MQISQRCFSPERPTDPIERAKNNADRARRSAENMSNGNIDSINGNLCLTQLYGKINGPQNNLQQPITAKKQMDQAIKYRTRIQVNKYGYNIAYGPGAGNFVG